QDQVIVGQGHVLPVRVGYEDTFLVFVHTCDLALDHGRVLLVLENPSDWKPNLTGGENRRGHLIEQRLKQVVVRAIDQDDFRRRLAESFGGSESAKSTADYDDSWLGHLLLNFLQSEMLS